MERASAIAPGGIGNIGPGLDVLGLAVSGLGDRVIAERVPGHGVTIADAGHPELPTEADRNTAGIAATHVLAFAGMASLGVRLTIVKGLPLSGGQGGGLSLSGAGSGSGNTITNTIIYII